GSTTAVYVANGPDKRADALPARQPIIILKDFDHPLNSVFCPLFSAMAANLTPQYLEAEAEYKKAKTAEERLTCLKKMYQLLPKHKASEKLQADLKTKISEAKDEAERERKSPKKAGGVSHKIPKQG